MGQVKNIIERMRAEIRAFTESNCLPSSFTEKFRNEENQRHYKEGRFSALNEAMAIINFYEATSSNTNDWDQDKLRDIFFAIKKHGDNPEEYIDLHYSVSEEKFNNWPEHIKNIFKPARINKETNND